MRRLRLTMSCASSLDGPFFDKSFRVLSNNLRLSSSSSLPQHFQHHHSFTLIHAHMTSTYFAALSWIFLPPSLSLITSFLILSSLVTLRIVSTSAFTPHPTSSLLLGTDDYCWCYYRLVNFPLDHQSYSSVSQNPPPPSHHTLPVFHPTLLHSSIVSCQPTLFWCYTIPWHQQVTCTTVIDPLSHRPVA